MGILRPTIKLKIPKNSTPAPKLSLGAVQRKTAQLLIQQQEVEIKVAHAWCQLKKPMLALKEANKKFSAFNKKAIFSKQYKQGCWNGVVSAVNKKDGTFGTGLLKPMIQFFENELGMSVVLNDLRGAMPEPQYNWQWTGITTLRPEQKDAIEIIKQNPQGILKLPTGVGKTETYLKVIQELGLKTLVSVPSEDLMRQTATRAMKSIRGAKIGILGGGTLCRDDDEIIIATQATLRSIMKRIGKGPFIEWAAQFEVYIADEVHTICSGNSESETLKMCMNIPAYWRIGISASPWETDTKPTPNELYLTSAFGPIIYDMGTKEAIEKHYIVPFQVFFMRPEYPTGYSHYQDYTNTEWRTAHEEYIVHNDIRNDYIVNAVLALVLEHNKKVLVIAQRLPHLELLANAISTLLKNKNVFTLHGSTQNREGILKQFAACKGASVLIASSVGNTGLDIVDIDAVVVAHGGKSFYQNLQRIGRGLRNAVGKESLVVIDFDDSILGKWFKAHMKERKKLYEELGGSIIHV